MSKPTRSAIKAEVSERTLGGNECHKPAAINGKVITGIQCDMSNLRYHCASEGVRKDTCELYDQCDRLSYVCPAFKMLIRSSTVGAGQQSNDSS